MTRERCDGVGLPGEDVDWRTRTAICPACHGIARIDDAGNVDDLHTVLVIDCGGDDIDDSETE